MRLIAEFCQNHNGDFEILKRMISEAAEGGATHGKIQTIFADDLAYREEFETGKEEDGKTVTIRRPYQPEYDRLKGLELTIDQHRQFADLARESGLEPLTTAFNITRVPELKNLGFKSIKVASYDCGSLPLIEELSKHFDELIISTGATYDDEIERTAKFLNDSNKDFTFLHCVTIYPTPLDVMNLNRMKYLQQYTKNVGLSEHTRTSADGVKACLVAIHHGAECIERHFTVLPEDQSKDGPVSIRKSHIEEMVSFSKLSPSDQEQYIKEKIPEADSMMGTETRPLSDEELLNRSYYRGRFTNKINEEQVFNWDTDFDWQSYLEAR